MAEDLELKLRLNADGNLQRELKRAETAVQGLGQSARSAGRNLSNGLGQASGSARSAAAESTKLAGALHQAGTAAARSGAENSDLNRALGQQAPAARQAAAENARLARTLDQQAAAADRSGKANASLNGAFTTAARGLVALVGVQEAWRAIRAADTMQQLEARVRLATEAQGDFNAVWSQLLDNASGNGARLADTIDLFTGISRAAPEIGATRDEVLQVVNAVQQLAALSGATGTQMSNAMLQFSQAMAGGVLRAEELNSIIENTPAIAEAIANGMGKTVGQLRQAVLAGTVLSRDVFGSLASQAPEIAQKFADLPVSIDRQINSLGNEVGRLISELDRLIGATSLVGLIIEGNRLLIQRAADALAAANGGPEETELLRTQRERLALFERQRRIQEEINKLQRAQEAYPNVAILQTRIDNAKSRLEDVRKRIKDVDADLVELNKKALEAGKTDAAKPPAQTAEELARIAAQDERRKQINAELLGLYKAQLAELARMGSAAKEVADRFAQTREQINQRPSDLTAGTVLEPLNTIRSGQRAVEKGDFEAAARAAEKAREQIAALGESTKVSKQFLNDLLNRAEAVAQSAVQGQRERVEQETASIKQTLLEAGVAAAELAKIEVGFDVAAALGSAEGLKAAIAALFAEPVVQLVEVRKVGGSGEPAAQPEGYAGGGLIRGPGGPTEDKVLMYGSAGEFMQPAASVSTYGLGFMEALRQRRISRRLTDTLMSGALPTFAAGGLVTQALANAAARAGTVPRYAEGGLVSSRLGAAVGASEAAAAARAGRPVTIVLDGQRFQATASDDEARALERAAMKRGRRVP